MSTRVPLIDGPMLCGLQGVVRAPLVSPGTLTTVGVVTTTYSVILPFVHDNNNLSTLFRNHWKEVGSCPISMSPLPLFLTYSLQALPRCTRAGARVEPCLPYIPTQQH